jgi:hypothetical protein
VVNTGSGIPGDAVSDFSDAYDEMLAAVVPIAPAYDDDIYGVDLSCTSDVDAGMRDVSGVEAVLQSDYRRLSTPHGSLCDATSSTLVDLDYGLDIMLCLNRRTSAEEIRELPSAIEAELMRDDRHADVHVDVTFRSNILRVSITGTLVGAGPFTLIVRATDAGVLLEAMSSNGQAID